MDSNKNALPAGESTDNGFGSPINTLACNYSKGLAAQIDQPNRDSNAMDSRLELSEDWLECGELQRRVEYYRELLSQASKPQTGERSKGTEKAASKMSPKKEQMHHHKIHNTIKKYLKKATMEHGMKGYAYALVLDNNEVLSGSSKSLSKWWNEVVKFKLPGPAAIKGNQNNAGEN